jgi:hypothetical protein
MSIIKAILHQIGLSADPAKNFNLNVPAAPDGTMKLSRGNAGAPTQDIMTVSTNGVIREPQKPIGNYPMGGTVAMQPTATRLPIYNGYSEGITFSNETAIIVTTGSYLITANLRTSAVSDAQIVGVRKNGTMLKEVQNTASGFQNSMALSFIAYLVAGDIIDLYGVRGSVACDAIGGNTSLELVMVK